MDPPTYPFEETSFMDGPLEYSIVAKNLTNFDLQGKNSITQPTK